MEFAQFKPLTDKDLTDKERKVLQQRGHTVEDLNTINRRNYEADIAAAKSRHAKQTKARKQRSRRIRGMTELPGDAQYIQQTLTEQRERELAQSVGNCYGQRKFVDADTISSFSLSQDITGVSSIAPFFADGQSLARQIFEFADSHSIHWTNTGADQVFEFTRFGVSLSALRTLSCTIHEVAATYHFHFHSSRF